MKISQIRQGRIFKNIKLENNYPISLYITVLCFTTNHVSMLVRWGEKKKSLIGVNKGIKLKISEKPKIKLD